MGKRRSPNPQHTRAYLRLRARLKELRLDADLTQVELGAVFKRPHTFIHKIESGDRRIDPIEFAKWCKACGEDPGDVLNELAG